MSYKIDYNGENNTSTYYEGKYAVATLNHNTDEFEVFELGVDDEAIYQEMTNNNNDGAFSQSDRDNQLKLIHS